MRTQGGTQFAWSRYETLVPLILGAAGLSSWLVYEYHIPSTPMLPLAILNDRTAVIGFIATLLMGIVQFSLLYFLPLYYEVCLALKCSPTIANGRFYRPQKPTHRWCRVLLW